MSAAAGVDYLNRDLQTYLEESRDSLFQEEEATVVAHALAAFEKTGTKNWSKATVEWFLVYLATELGATPHNLRQGHNAVAILNAFQYVVQGLVSLLPRTRFESTMADEQFRNDVVSTNGNVKKPSNSSGNSSLAPTNLAI